MSRNRNYFLLDPVFGRGYAQAMDSDFLIARYTKCKEMIIAYEDAIDALVGQGAQSYSLNTGQTSQTVTRKNTKELQEQLESLMVRCDVLHARIYGGGTTRGIPAW